MDKLLLSYGRPFLPSKGSVITEFSSAHFQEESSNHQFLLVLFKRFSLHLLPKFFRHAKTSLFVSICLHFVVER